jgi:hypothetical protein
MASPTKTERASSIMGYEDAAEPFEDGEPEDVRSVAPLREVWTDRVDDRDVDCAFTVAADGVRDTDHIQQRTALLSSPPTLSTGALAWARAVEDVLLEEIEQLQDDSLASQDSIDNLQSQVRLLCKLSVRFSAPLARRRRRTQSLCVFDLRYTKLIGGEEDSLVNSVYCKEVGTVCATQKA